MATGAHTGSAGHCIGGRRRYREKPPLLSGSCRALRHRFQQPDDSKSPTEAGHNRKAHLFAMDAQQMAFPDNTFDTVVTSCVFCSVPDPLAGLREIRRVCKPQGRVVMLEHVRSGHPFIGPLMDVLNPIPLTDQRRKYQQEHRP